MKIVLSIYLKSLYIQLFILVYINILSFGSEHSQGYTTIPPFPRSPPRVWIMIVLPAMSDLLTARSDLLTVVTARSDLLIGPRSDFLIVLTVQSCFVDRVDQTQVRFVDRFLFRICLFEISLFGFVLVQMFLV